MRPTTMLRAGFVLLASLFVQSPASADWPPNPTFGGVAVCTVSSFRWSLMSVPDGAGGVYLTWLGNSAVFAQHVDARGTPLWGANGLALAPTSPTQSSPVLLADGEGGAIVVWVDQRSGNSDIYAQRLNAAGVAQWTANGVAVCAAASTQDSPTAAVAEGGNLVVAWRDLRQGAESDIYVQCLSPSGAPQLTANGYAVCSAANDQSQPSLASDALGGFYLAWADRRNNVATDADIFLTRLDSSGGLAWPSSVDGLIVVDAIGPQSAPRLATDGNGGVFVTWNDGRSGTYDIYAQHFLSTDLSLLPDDGAVVCDAPGNQLAPAIVPDGTGGVVIAWQDGRPGSTTDLYAARITGADVMPWQPNGVAVCNAAGSQSVLSLNADGNGGAVLAWSDGRTTFPDIYAQRVSNGGAVVWQTDGVPVCTGPLAQTEPVIAYGDDGSCVVAWIDQRASSWHVYAQRVDTWGNLGRPEPQITQARDVAADQGGAVKVTWAASYLDAYPTYGIMEYRVFRSVPVALALASRRPMTSDPDRAAESGALLVMPNAAADLGWEYVGTQAAEALGAYSRVVATTGDSSAAGNKRTLFMVEARAGSLPSSPRWFSLPDSGYSVDNLPPAAPAALTGQYAGGTTHLLWQPNAEADLAHYAIYRGTTVGFTPSSTNRVSAATLPGYADAAGAPYVYKVTAVDVHGNESPVATLIPSGTLGVGDAPAALEFATPQPNPARGSTTLRWSLPHATHVTLALYDAAGRRVATVADGVMPAGTHSATLRLEDAQGRALPSGLYLARFEAEGRAITRRIAAIR